MKTKIYFYIFLSLLTTKINSHKLFLFSIPKCGTHLLAKAIELISKKELSAEVKADTMINFRIPEIKNDKYFIRCHMPYLKPVADELINKNYKAFFIYRDPRDQIVSRAYWIQKRQTSKQSIPELIDFLISNIKPYYNNFLSWKNDKRFCTLKFENLVGELGGGNNELQRKELRKIFKYLDIKLNAHLIQHTVKNLYGGTYTFREGKIGSWKTHFSPTQKQKFKESASDLLIQLGYEKNLNW